VPAKSAIAATGVKFGQCGSSLIRAAMKMTDKTIKNFGVIDL
jgi:hypothetical protein